MKQPIRKPQKPKGQPVLGVLKEEEDSKKAPKKIKKG
jgi:hypothetical protein